MEVRGQTLRQAGQRGYETSDLRLCHAGLIRGHSAVFLDWPVPEADGVPHRYFLPLLRRLLRTVPLGNRDAVPLLVRLGRDAGRDNERGSLVSRVSAQHLCILYHDRAELLGN